MAELKQLLKDALKDNAEALKSVEEAIKDCKFVDLKDGGYVDTKKYNDLETKYNELKDAPNPLQEEIDKLKADNAASIQAEKEKMTSKVKALAIDKEISSLGVTDELKIAGLKSLIKVDEIKVDDDYNITGGLSEQITKFKDTFKSSFEEPKVVSTGQSLQQSSVVNVARKYNSLADIKALTPAEVKADLANIQAQLPNLK